MSINFKAGRLSIIFLMLFAGFTLSFTSSLMTANVAYADGGGWDIELPGQNEIPPQTGGGCGLACPTPGPAPNPAPPGGGGSPPGGGGGGGGGGGSTGYMVEWTDGSGCGVKVVDGKSYSASTRSTYKPQLLWNPGKNPPTFGKDWVLYSRAPDGGSYWNGKMLVGSPTCVWPEVYVQRYQQICNISVKVQIGMVAPTRKTDPAVTGYTAYPRGSKDWNACAASRSNPYKVSTAKKINQYGYYEVYGNEENVLMNKKITTVYDERGRGAYTTEEITVGTPYSPRGWHLLNSLSVDCKNGAKMPGIMVSDWSEQPCQGTKAWSSHVCKTSPIQYDTSDGSGTSMRGIGTPKVQFLRDGKARKMIFDQNIVGPNLKVNTYKTKFLRSADSTPWNSSKSYNNNLFSLTRSGSDTNILSINNGTESPTYNGRINTVFASGYYASEQGAPTKITQQVNWTGIRTITSVQITGVSSDGRILLSNITLQIPTSGICTNTGTIDYIRAIGHEAG